MMVGEAKVKRGFSMPPKGKEGGKIRIVYLPQMYGVNQASVRFKR